MNKLEFVLAYANNEIAMRFENEIAHTDHTNYSDSYCVGIE